MSPKLPIFNPISLLSLAVMVVGAVLRNPAMFAIGMVALVGNLFVVANAHTRKAYEASGEQELSNEARSLLRPIRRQHDDLQAFVSENGKGGVVKVLGTEAIGEAAHILEQSVRMLKLRDSLKKMLKGKSEAEVELGRLELSSDPTFAGAREARETELKHYGEIEAKLPKIDAGLQQAAAALSELKARLALAASAEAGEATGDELTETVTRLKAISASFDEAEEMLKVTVG